MGIKAKLIGQTEIKTGGDVFHDIFKERPHHLTTMSPKKVQGFKLLEGKLGTVGSVISWDYTHDDKLSYAKEIIEVVDEEKKSMVLKVIEGDVLELYKSFVVTYHVDTIGVNDHLVTWTLEYEKIDVDTPHPATLLNFFLHLIEDIEYHHQEK